MKLSSMKMFKLHAETMWKNLTLTFRRGVSFNV